MKRQRGKKSSYTTSIPTSHWWQVSVLSLLGGIILLYPGHNVLINEVFSTQDKRPSNMLGIPPIHPYPINKTGIYPGEDVTASGVIVLDAESMVYMYKRNETMLLSPASTTKILTALVALDAYALDDVITVGRVENDGQVMDLVEGEKITVENLLYGALIHSGNDAAYALADAYPGGRNAFIQEMNRKARAIGLSGSTFTNPSGYDGDTHKVTPMDLSRLAVAALGNKTVMKMVAIPQITISDIYHSRFHKLSNVNQLLGKIPGVAGIKTGWTEDAGENLVTLVERGSKKVIFVVLHSKDRFGDTTKLIDWVYGNYHWVDVAGTVGSTAP